jgi:hypothetical protein
MARDLVDHNRPVFDFLHPRIYAAAVGLVVWFALAAWILFDHRFGKSGEVSLSLTMVSVLLFVAVLLPWALSLVWRRHRKPYDGQTQDIVFRDWRGGDVEVWGSRLRTMHAAIDVLLPLMAVAFGLTAIGIVFLICASLAS